VQLIENVNSAVNNFVWGLPMLVLLVGTGILMTALTGFFQVTHIGHWFKSTLGGDL
jgi:AGCS family alanine or glycine:cation symporter